MTVPVNTNLNAISSAHAIPEFKKFAPVIVPEFCMTAPALRHAVDQIADYAMSGMEQATAAMAHASADVLPILTVLHALFSSIGRVADATADDIGADLDEVWSVAQT